jgi:hypothetical protein
MVMKTPEVKGLDEDTIWAKTLSSTASTVQRMTVPKTRSQNAVVTPKFPRRGEK